MEAPHSDQNRRLSDEALWARYVSGDREAFGVLYSRYHKSLTAYCLGRLKERELAENAASDTLMKLLGHPNPAVIENFESWLFAVAKNECNTYWSTLERRRKLLKDNLTVDLEHDPEGERQFAVENVDAFLRSQLDDIDYRIWNLYHDGYDNAEVATMMGLNEKTVANRKSVARSKLKEMLRKSRSNET